MESVYDIRRCKARQHMRSVYGVEQCQQASTQESIFGVLSIMKHFFQVPLQRQ
jgi:hypothetical protein